MLYFDIDAQLDRRKKDFSNNLRRAQGLARLSQTLREGMNSRELLLCDSSGIDCNTISKDIGGYSIVATVSAIDLLIKNVSIDVVLGMLLGKFSPPKKVRVTLPVFSARTLLDIYEMGESCPVSSQFASMVIESLADHYGRNNYQASASVFGQLKDLGLGSKSDFIRDESLRKEFSDTLDELADIRHVVVHRLGDTAPILFDDGRTVYDSLPWVDSAKIEIISKGGCAIVERIFLLASSEYSG